MRLTLSCMQCLQEQGRPNGASRVEIRDDGCYKAICPSGHTTATVLQQQKYEVLFEIGVNAILDGYYREAVSSFTSSLERFYEYAIRIFLEESSGSDELFQVTWKNVSNMSERQLGAFIFLWATHFKESPILLHQDMTKFRNDVIHKGKIPSRDEAVKYGEAVLAVLRPKIQKVNNTFAEQARNSNFRHMQASVGKADGQHVSSMFIVTALNHVPEKSLEEYIPIADDMRTRLSKLQEYLDLIPRQ